MTRVGGPLLVAIVLLAPMAALAEGDAGHDAQGDPKGQVAFEQTERGATIRAFDGDFGSHVVGLFCRRAAGGHCCRLDRRFATGRRGKIGRAHV